MTSESLVSATPGAISVPSDVAALAAASISPNTKRSYAAALSRLDAWLESGELLPQELTDATLSAYVAQMHEAGRSPATASLVVAAVRFRAKLQGAESPVGPLTDRTFAGFRRAARDRGRGQVQGIQFAQADAAAALAGNGGGSLAGLRDAALLAVASDGLLRLAEIAALQVEDVQFEADGTGRLHIRHSKTDQEGRGDVLFLGEPTARRTFAWIAAAGLETGPLFRRIRRGDNLGDAFPLSGVAIRKIIQRRAADAGIEGRVSGHSLRVGAAQSLAAGGASLAEMQTAGRWTSPAMPGHYARGQLAARGAVARIRYGGLTK